MVKKKWDPVAGSLSEQKLKRLPGNPVLVLSPNGPGESLRRNKHWKQMMQQLGKLVTVAMPMNNINTTNTTVNVTAVNDDETPVHVPAPETRVVHLLR